MIPSNENAPATGMARGVEVAGFDGLHGNDTTPAIFTFETIAPVRVVVIDGEPWFVGKDVAELLGYARPNDALQQHCKGAVKRRTLLTAGGPQELRIISEPDLWRLVAKSQLPEAQRVEAWIFEKVLPEVRRTGNYGAPAIPENFAAALRLAADQVERIEAQAAQIEHQRPAVEFVEGYVAASGTASIREAGKVLNIPQNRFIGWLEDEGILFRQSGRLMPSATYQKRGFFTVKTGQAHDRSFSQVRITSSGIEWLARRWAKRNGAEEVLS